MSLRSAIVFSAILLGTSLAEQVEKKALPDADAAAIVREKMAQLDDEEFLVRQRASAAILEIGLPAVPQLVAAAKADSVELRARAMALLRMIHGRRLSAGFRELGKCPNDAVDVEHGMWLIALMLDPDVTKKSIAAKLDEMAGAVRKSIGESVDPKSLSGAEVMLAVTGVLKDKYGLKGEEENYDHPDNSSIHRVLEKKSGLPILLSEIAVAVGRRLDVPIVGVPVPGRYMIKYDGARAPLGAPRQDVIVDPYGGWKVTTPELLQRTARFFHPAMHLAPSDGRATLERMLNNLESDAVEHGELGQARAARVYRSMLTATPR